MAEKRMHSAVYEALGVAQVRHRYGPDGREWSEGSWEESGPDQCSEGGEDEYLLGMGSITFT